MSDVTRSRALPANPNLEHLKNEAKARLSALRADAPDAQLAEAQFQIAREYGFSSWRALKDEVDRRNCRIDIASPLEAYAGFYLADPAVMINSVMTVTVENGKLYTQVLTGPKMAKTRLPDGWFQTEGVPVRLGFADVRDGRAQIMLMDNDGHVRHLHRVDAQKAEETRKAQAKAAAEQKRPRIQTQLPPEILSRYAGQYVSHAGVAFTIICEEEKIFAQVSGQPRLEIFPESETEFFWKVVPAQIVFALEDGKATKARLHQNGMVITFLPASEKQMADATALTEKRRADQTRPRKVADIDTTVLARYAGVYKLIEGRNLTVTVEDGHIFTQMTGQDRHEIYPESERDFFLTVTAAQITFMVDVSGRVSHLVLHQAGRDIPMARIMDADAAA